MYDESEVFGVEDPVELPEGGLEVDLLERRVRRLRDRVVGHQLTLGNGKRRITLLCPRLQFVQILSSACLKTIEISIPALDAGRNSKVRRSIRGGGAQPSVKKLPSNSRFVCT